MFGLSHYGYGVRCTVPEPSQQVLVDGDIIYVHTAISGSLVVDSEPYDLLGVLGCAPDDSDRRWTLLNRQYIQWILSG